MGKILCIISILSVTLTLTACGQKYIDGQSASLKGDDVLFVVAPKDFDDI
jgi:hypothetical protein